MTETFKQLKKGEDSMGETTGQLGNKNINRTTRAMGAKKGDTNAAEAGGEDLEEDKAIKERDAPMKVVDDDDELSEDEKELMNEINHEMDGNVKHAKDVRGYEDHKDDSVSEEDGKANGFNSEDEGLEKYIKPLRETHSKYLQYLRNIDFDKEKSTASVDLAFPLEFKKVLMLTIAE